MQQDNSDKDIGNWRDKIDAIDDQLLELFNRRAGYALEIGKIKRMISRPVYCPQREEQIYSHIREINSGPLSDSAVSRLFERIIDETRRLEREQSEGCENGH
ncbi:chorismate mutase [Gemmatimonadota bacterium]